MVQASKEEIGPVLLVHDSAGFPFGLDADGSLTLLPLDRLSRHDATNGLTVFASADTALSATLQPSKLGGCNTLILVDSWDGHDPALWNFNLLFLAERLKLAGAGPVVFLVTEPDLAPHWDSSLIVRHADLPLPPLAVSPRRPGRANAVGLLLDPDPDLAEDLVNWAAAAFPSAGAALRLLPGPGAAVPESAPPTLHVVAEADVRAGWLLPRIDLLTGHGFHGWKRRLGALARQSGVPTVDLSAPGGRQTALDMLSTPPDADATAVRAPVSLADWFRERFREAAGRAAA